MTNTQRHPARRRLGGGAAPLVLLGILILSFTGCAPANRNPGSSGAGERCHDDDGCERNLMCWPTPAPSAGCGTEQAPMMLCGNDQDCGDGLVCAATPPDPGQCIFQEGRACRPRCESHSACPPGRLCDRARGTCESPTCASGEVCPANYDCAAHSGVCYPSSCQSAADCADGFVCYDALCIARDCRRDGECSAGEHCVAGRCGNARCERDADCSHLVFDTCVNGRCAEQRGWCNLPATVP